MNQRPKCTRLNYKANEKNLKWYFLTSSCGMASWINEAQTILSKTNGYNYIKF